jgi:peptide/nickel transport system permease protein
MILYIVRRILWMMPLLFGVSIISFGLSHLSPGNTSDLLLRQSGGVTSSESALRFKHELGLDKPLPMQYLSWLGKAIFFEFGDSFATGEPVRQVMLQRLPATLKLTATTFVIMMVLSLLMGIPAGLKPGGIFDRICRMLSTVVIALPNYLIGLFVLYLFGVRWKVFSVIGNSAGWQILMPAFTLAVGMSAVYSRLVRERILDVFSQDYIRTAQAKGLALPTVLFRHALRNALMPLISLWGMSLGYMLGGSLLIETIFSWPGVAGFAVQAVLNRDFPVTQCYVLLMALIFSLSNLTVDILQTFADPRLRRSLGTKQK